MQRFILQENVARFQQLLADEMLDARSRGMVRSLLVAARRDLAIFDSISSGVEPDALAIASSRRFLSQSAQAVHEFQGAFEGSQQPFLLIDPRPGLHIVDLNDAYAQVTLTERARIAGEKLFDAFPDNPNDPGADGVNNLYVSLRTAADTKRPHVMQIQRYDVRDSSGYFVERHWRPVNTPLFDEDGRLRYLLHQVEDVTAAVKALQHGRR
jgi:PAS domain-containing protein